MFGRKAAYRAGHIDGLEDLKADLFVESERRIDDRQPFDVGTLSQFVMDAINARIRKS